MPEARYKELISKLRGIVQQYEEYNPDATDTAEVSDRAGEGKEYGTTEDRLAHIYDESGSEMDSKDNEEKAMPYAGEETEEEENLEDDMKGRRPIRHTRTPKY